MFPELFCSPPQLSLSAVNSTVVKYTKTQDLAVAQRLPRRVAVQRLNRVWDRRKTRRIWSVLEVVAAGRDMHSKVRCFPFCFFRFLSNPYVPFVERRTSFFRRGAVSCPPLRFRVGSLAVERLGRKKDMRIETVL